MLPTFLWGRSMNFCLKYYTKINYNVKDFNKVQSKYKTYVIKYTKGLGSLDDKESKDMYQNPNFIYFKYDNLADNMFKKWFSKDAADTRKSMLSNNNVEE